MATLNISITTVMREWIDTQIESGIYANASDYMRDLIRHHQQEQIAIRHALEAGAKSELSDLTVEEIIVQARARNEAKLPTN